MSRRIIPLPLRGLIVFLVSKLRDIPLLSTHRGNEVPLSKQRGILLPTSSRSRHSATFEASTYSAAVEASTSSVASVEVQVFPAAKVSM